MQPFACEVQVVGSAVVAEGTRWSLERINPSEGLGGLLAQLQHRIPRPTAVQLTGVLLWDEDFDEWLVLQQPSELKDRQASPVKIKLTTDRDLLANVASQQPEPQAARMDASAAGRSKTATEEEKKDAARLTFAKFDKDGEGTLNILEVTQMCAKIDPNITTQQIKTLFDAADTDQSGTICFDEFFLATTSINTALRSPGLPAARDGRRVTPMSAVELLAGDPAQRSEAYALLDACQDMDVAVACVPGVVRLLAADAEKVGAAEYRRLGQIMASLIVRGSDARVTVAILRQDWRTYWNAERSVLGRTLAKDASELTTSDVLPMLGIGIPSYSIWTWGLTNTLSLIGGGLDEQPVTAELEWEYFERWTTSPWKPGGLRPNSDAYNTRLVRLALEVIQSTDVYQLSKVEQMGVWILIHDSMFSRPAIGRAMLEDDTQFIDTAVAWAGRDPAGWQTLTSKEVWRSPAVCAVQEAAMSCQVLGLDPVPELLRSGYFDLIIDGLCAFHARGVSAKDPSLDVASHMYILAFNLALLDLSVHEEAWTKLEASADALEYSMRQDVVQAGNLGLTSQAFFSMVSAMVFGRAESEAAPIKLLQSDIDSALKMCQELLCPASWGGAWQLVVTVGKCCLSLSISDTNKELLLRWRSEDGQHDFISHLLTGLGFGLYEENAMRKETPDAVKHAIQSHYAESILQIALYPPGAQALKASPLPVLQTLRTLQAEAWTDAARRSAEAALMTLDPPAVTAPVHRKAKGGHVMLSYNWGHQDVIKRLNASLKARGYTTWIDIEKMQGSTVEAMADAVEECAVMVFGISMAYKESTNCRMEAQYAFQQQKDMVPVMLEEEYRPNGWLGMLLGTRVWYPLCGESLSSEGAFESKVDELCRELGDRGQLQPVPPVATPEGVPPQTPAAATAPAAAGRVVGQSLAAIDASFGFTPSLRMEAAPSPSPSVGGTMQQAVRLQQETSSLQVGAGSVSDVLAFLSTRLDQADAQRREAEAKLEAKLEAWTVSAAQLEAVQARVKQLHAAQLLSDDELHSVEDTVADCIMGMATGGMAASVVIQMVGLSEKMADDSAFARQLRRKFI